MQITKLVIPFSDETLHQFKSGKKDQYCFGGKEIAKMLGYKNLPKAIKDASLIPNDDYIIVEKSQCSKNLWQEVNNCGLVTSSTSRFTIIYESGFWKLAMMCTLPHGVKLRTWLATEVLPSIRKTGSYSLESMGVSANQLLTHTSRSVQISNSKSINALMYEKKGVEGIVKYNQENCKQVTGITPSEVKRAYGRPCKSAKEVLRKTDPAKAMTMSVNDYLVVKANADLENLKEMDKHLIKVFEEMNRIGINLIMED